MRARSAPNLSVRLLADHVHVEVSDTSASAVARRALTSERPGGRGLPLVDAIAERWVTVLLPTGKVVWSDVLRHPR